MNPIQEDWNRSARAYEQFNTAPDSYSACIEWPCVQTLLPPIRGKRVLDLGCGTGIFTFLLERLEPSRLLGLDLSEEMLAIARQKASARASRAEFRLGDAARAADLTGETFDLVFSSTMTHYLPTLPPLMAQIARCLAPGGVCVLSVIHPVYSAQYPVARGGAFPRDEDWTVRYLDRSLRAYVQPWIEYNDEVENRLSASYHHTFGDYAEAIHAAGLRLEAVREPLPPESWQGDFRCESFVETPAYMVLKITR